MPLHSTFYHALWSPFQQKIAYLGINLTKEVKDVYSENYRTLNKKLEKEDTNNERIYPVHELEELMSLKCPYCPKYSIDSSISYLNKWLRHQFLTPGYPIFYQLLLIPSSKYVFTLQSYIMKS